MITFFFILQKEDKYEIWNPKFRLYNHFHDLARCHGFHEHITFHKASTNQVETKSQIGNTLLYPFMYRHRIQEITNREYKPG